MNGLSVGAGRAHRLRHVHLAGPARIEIIGGADIGAHLAGCVVDRDDGDRDFRPERLRALARELLQRALQVRIDGEAVNADIRLGRDDLVGGMRRQHRQLLARMGNGLRLGVGDLVTRHDAGCRDAVEHAVARLARGFG